MVDEGSLVIRLQLGEGLWGEFLRSAFFHSRHFANFQGEDQNRFAKCFSVHRCCLDLLIVLGGGEWRFRTQELETSVWNGVAQGFVLSTLNSFALSDSF